MNCITIPWSLTLEESEVVGMMLVEQVCELSRGGILVLQGFLGEVLELHVLLERLRRMEVK